MRITFLAILFAAVAVGQTAVLRTETAAPPKVVSPEVLSDHRVVFRLYAPKAAEVTVAGDFWLQPKRAGLLVKDDRGVWSFTTDSLPPDIYSYYFTVDGVLMPDPVNGWIKPGSIATQSMFAIPGSRESILEDNPVPHGEVRMVYYQSTVLGKPRRMHIYFPPGYEKGQTRYPVLYLMHGGGDDDSAWVAIGRMNFILDNLIAEGKAKPMIVVMPSLWAIDPPLEAARFNEDAALFQKTFIQEILPYVERHYRVLRGPANRAFGGLGAGRNMLPGILWPSIDKFNTIVFTAGGTDPGVFAALNKQYPGVIDNPANIQRVRFFIGGGANDESVSSGEFLAQELKKRGYKTTFYRTDDTHGWPGFRRYFEAFVQTAFR